MEFFEFVTGDYGWIAVIAAMGVFSLIMRILKKPTE